MRRHLTNIAGLLAALAVLCIVLVIVGFGIVRNVRANPPSQLPDSPTSYPVSWP